MGLFNDHYDNEIHKLNMNYQVLKDKIDELQMRSGMSIDRINTMLKNGWSIDWKANRSYGEGKIWPQD